MSPRTESSHGPSGGEELAGLTASDRLRDASLPSPENPSHDHESIEPATHQRPGVPRSFESGRACRQSQADWRCMVPAASGQRPAASGQRLGHAQLIQVARVVVVDGKPGQVAQVADVAIAFRACLTRGLGLLQGLRRKSGQQAPGAHGLDGDSVQIDGVHKMP